MPASRTVYCSHCQDFTRPVKGMVNYRCPSCGATFMASDIEKASSDEESAREVVSGTAPHTNEPCLTS